MTKTTSPTRDTGTLLWGWLILAVTSGTSVAFNLRHALYGPSAGTLPAALAVMYGVMPVLVALALSHTIARRGAHPVEVAIGAAVFLTALVLSVSSIADVLTPLAGEVRGYAFAVMLDVAGLMGFRQVNSAMSAGRGKHARTDPGTGGIRMVSEDRPGNSPESGRDRPDLSGGAGRTGVRAAPDGGGRMDPDGSGPDRTDPHHTGSGSDPDPTRITPPAPVPVLPDPDPHQPIPLWSGPVPVRNAQVTAPTPRQKLAAELAPQIRAAARDGRKWNPDYDELMARTGYGRSSCEKAVTLARRIVRTDPDGTATPESGSESADPDPEPARASG